MALNLNSRYDPTCEYEFHCNTCHLTRKFGVAKLRMEVQAGIHARRFDSHRIVLREVRTYHEFGSRDNQPTLDSAEDPPF